jgi:NAD(P)-dependent dehydrogenase (short-subunit alcohol dehydrogenase family)
MKLQDKTAFITGAGRGIGRSIALAFAEAGCHVAVASRTLEEVQDTAAEASRFGVQALPLLCDVTDYESVQRAVEEGLQHLGHINILVNNAGFACFKPFTEMGLDEWQYTVNANLTSAFLMIQALLPSMITRGEGRIINISSVAGVKPIAEQSAYCASKAGLNALTKVLALELNPLGIAVHAICPGGVVTRLAEDAMPDRDKSEWMLPEDIADAALYLATQSHRAATDTLIVRRSGSTPL